MPQAKDEQSKEERGRKVFGEAGPGQFDQHGNVTEQPGWDDRRQAGQEDQSKAGQEGQSKALRPGQTESLAAQEREQLQKRQQDAWEEATRRDQDNNPATKDQRRDYYTKENQPGLHPANQPSPDSKLNKGTRLDLEDLTGNPGHRGVNPDAPANSINKATDPKTGRLESINEPPHIDQNWPKAGQRDTAEQTSVYDGQKGSINEPEGSEVVPTGQGQGTGQGQKTIRLDKLTPDHLPVGPTPDFILTVSGLQLDKDCVIVFNDQELETTLKQGKLEARAPMTQLPKVVAVRVKKKDEYSNKLEFTFEDPQSGRGARDDDGNDNERDPHDHRGGSDRDDTDDERGSSRNRRR